MCRIQFSPLSPWLKHSHSLSRRSRLFLIIPESSSCSALLRLTLYFPQHKGLSHKWKLVQSHLPRLTVSFCSRVPLPITLAGVFSSNISFVWPSGGKSASHSFIHWRLCFSMYVVTWVDILTIHLAPVLSLIQLLGAWESAKGSLAVNYWIVSSHMVTKKVIFSTWRSLQINHRGNGFKVRQLLTQAGAFAIKKLVL